MTRSLVLGAVCVVLSLTAAEAGQSRATEEEPAPHPSPIRTVSAAVPESEPVCSRIRRRLWLEGEGWVVRKIATCH